MSTMLQNIVHNDIKNFTNILKKKLPESLMAIKFIETCSNMKKNDENVDISLLCDENSMKTGVFIGIFKVGEEHSAVTFYAFDSYESDLARALNQINIDTRNVRFQIVYPKHNKLFERFCLKNSFKIVASEVFIFSMSIQEASAIEIRCPPDVELRPLTEQHVNEIYEIWLMRNSFSRKYLRSCIQCNESWGVFCKKTDELLSRCLISHNGAITALQTVEKAKGKGYAQLLVKQISKSLGEKNIVPVSFVDTWNTRSCQVFRKVGYEVVAEVVNYQAFKDL